MSQRIYTNRSETVAHALNLVVTLGMVEETASESEKLRGLIRYAGDRLEEDLDRVERIQAYEELAGDEERSVAIRASVLNAADRGYL